MEYGLAPRIVASLGELDHLANELYSAGQLRAIVAAGGDGTVAEIVNRTTNDIPVTVFPLGTANLLARYFRVEANPAKVAHMILEGATIRLDAGRANGRVFLLMAGCGFDADVVERLHRRRTGSHISYWSWTRPILESIRSYRYPDLRVYCEPMSGSNLELCGESVRWVFVVNLPAYAGGLQLAPEAVATDGALNLSTFEKGTLWHGLRYLAHVACGWHRRLADYRTRLVRRLRIESHEQVPYQLDGDPGGYLPLDIEVLPQRVTLVVPLEQAARIARPTEMKRRNHDGANELCWITLLRSAHTLAAKDSVCS